MTKHVYLPTTIISDKKSSFVLAPVFYESYGDENKAGDVSATDSKNTLT